MKLLAATIAVPIALIGWQWWGDHSLEQRLAPIASSVAGRPIRVDCQGFWAAWSTCRAARAKCASTPGGIPEAKLFITRRTCGRLEDFTKSAHHSERHCLGALDWSRSDPLPFESECYGEAAETIYAVLILAHEAYHAAGVTDEATTNCYALQAMTWTATQLGAEPFEAELLARAMEALEPYQGPEYGTQECHAGTAARSASRDAELPDRASARAAERPRWAARIASGAV